eukprot:GHVU01060496.1.p1 GENE.GHVU01060496.1~~GHVU01060496.1.p1  ORF type:complete len:189 (-),score=12.96 GHVU01060496.1:46-612(-)
MQLGIRRSCIGLRRRRLFVCEIFILSSSDRIRRSRNYLTHANCSDEFASEEGAEAYRKLTSSQKMVPIVILLSDFVRSIGAGMTVKFDSLFSINDCGYTPAMISTVTIFYGLCIALCMNSAKNVGQRICDSAGRRRQSSTSRLVLLFFSDSSTHVCRLPLVLLFHFLRGAFQNGISPLDRAIVAEMSE